MRSIAIKRSEALVEESRRRGGSMTTAKTGATAKTGTFKAPSAHEPNRAARGAERRRYDRYAVRCECWIEHDAATVHGQAADLGLGGVFLRTAVPVESGCHVDVLLVFGHDAQRVRARGIVTRIVAAERGRRHGIGIELTDIFEGGELLAKLGITAP
jgi:hypothetical protein